MAEEVRRERVHLRNDANASDQSIRSISHNWLYRFKSRHPELAKIWMGSLVQSRFSEANYDVVRHWFNAITEEWIEH